MVVEMLFLRDLNQFMFRLFFRGALMAHNEVTEKQIKNIKRKLVGFIWDAPTKRIIELCLFVGIRLPKNLVEKFVSKDFDSQS